MRIARPLIEQGRLPNLGRLSREGVADVLRSARPIESPRIWNTIATGKQPAKHGILSFAHDGPDGRPLLYLSTDRQVHALWNIASDAGLTVGVVNWWNTYPPERIQGVMVSDHLLASEIEERQRMTQAEELPIRPLVYPQSWHRRLMRLVRESGPLTRIVNPFDRSEGFPHWVRAAIGTLSRKYWEDGLVTRIALETEEELEPDLLMVFLAGIDRVSHHLWGMVEPPESYPPELRASESERRTGAAALRSYYEYTDALIGLLMERYGPEDLILVVSDHGFEAGVEMMVLTGVHESEAALDGVIFARGRGIEAGKAPGPVSVEDVTPTILAWLGLPIAQDMDGRPAGFLRAAPPETIATYDTTPVERISQAASGSEQRIIEQLQALGYLE